MNESDAFRLDKQRVRRRFDAAAARYDQAAVLQREVCQRLLDRLDWIRLEPARILDAGCGTGQGVRGLSRRYRKAHVTALDLSPAMLAQLGADWRWWRRPSRVCADVERLPLADASFDLIFSSLTLQWCNDLDAVLAEFRRVLAPNGLLMFTTLGPDTLKELRQAWISVDGHVHVNAFMDMHDVGDALVRTGFADPVMDMDMITLSYADLHGLMSDLRAIGASNANLGRPRGLTTPRRLQAVARALEGFRDAGGRLPASHEVIFGHAWAPNAPAPGLGAGRRHIPIISQN